MQIRSDNTKYATSYISFRNGHDSISIYSNVAHFIVITWQPWSTKGKLVWACLSWVGLHLDGNNLHVLHSFSLLLDLPVSDCVRYVGETITIESNYDSLCIRCSEIDWVWYNVLQLSWDWRQTTSVQFGLLCYPVNKFTGNLISFGWNISK